MKAQSSGRAATLLAAIGVVGTVSAARAEIVTATVTGIFGAATDLYLFFPNSPSPVTLDGDPFSTTFVYDTSLGTSITTANSDTIEGGSADSPILSATLTAEGKTFAVTGFDDVSVGIGGGLGIYAVTADNLSTDRSINVFLYPTGGVPDSLDTPFSGTDPSKGTGTFDVTAGGSAVSFGNLIPETVTVTLGIPEPSTWAMMLLGFAGLGFLCYRTSRRGVSIAA